MSVVFGFLTWNLSWAHFTFWDSGTDISITGIKERYAEFMALLNVLKGCASYIFASLFCMSKREHLLSKEKCLLFRFKSSFHSWYSNVMMLLNA